ncbi:MAG: hypothetical protein P1P88_25775, partial [Bacteroidales bacterium]|nr:hypothetical protein [Bacteroidales bacterium]
NDSYSSYLSNTDKNLNDGLLSDSQNQNKRAKAMGYTAVGIWGINLIWTAIKVKNSKQNEISSLNNKNFVFYTGYDPFTKTASFNLRIQF